MGIDVYMQWDGQTEGNREYTGAAGYLRGAYFGGYSDVLGELFDWMDWDNDAAPFDPDAFSAKLDTLIATNGKRPGEGEWDHTKGKDRGWDLSDRQNAPIVPEAFEEYKAFLALGRRLISEGKSPTILISY
jgi:hypothetical protein